MTEQPEQKSSGVWQVLFTLVLYHIISDVLKIWFIEPVAIGTAAFAVSLITYWFVPNKKLGFLKWALVSLLLIVGFVGLVFVVFPPLCKQFGPAITWGFGAFILMVSFRFAPGFFWEKPKYELWKWLAISAGWGLLVAFFAYINPEGFCKQ